MSDDNLTLNAKKMSNLDHRVIDHYMLWFAFTASTDIENDLRYRSLLRYLTARGLVVE